MSAGTARLARAIRQRHTDMSPVTGSPLGPLDLRTLSRAFTSHDISVHILRPDEVLTLTLAAAHAQHIEATEAQWHEQLALWTGAGRILGTVGRLRLPTRPGDHDRAATFVVLHGGGDQDIEWLHAGEALSTGWVVATQPGMSVLPFSAPIENTQAREALRRARPRPSVPDDASGQAYVRSRRGTLHAAEYRRDLQGTTPPMRLGLSPLPVALCCGA
ncbi:hypothetical protein [Actinoplanes sichuanensis]|uniref:hypothetical protein n=1 Tax=Actinoplanes sichuanensis TaxID=512349 RepID=UPI00295334B6|nr:hypothetical protein [Actinoplanes sichuanensis]